MKIHYLKRGFTALALAFVFTSGYTQTWQGDSTTVYNLNANIGLGTSTPLGKLHVNGDIFASGTLYAGGLNIFNLAADSLKYIKDIKLLNGLHISGETETAIFSSTYKLMLQSDASTNLSTVINANNSGNVGIGTENPTEKLEVSGNTILGGNALVSNTLTVNQNLNFGSHYGMRYIGGTSPAPNYLSFGPLTDGAGPVPPSLPSCMAAPFQTVNAFQGAIQSYGYAINGGQPNTVTMGYNGANGVIELAGSDSARLLINHDCGREINMCTGPDKGFVVIGQNLEIGRVSRDESTTLKMEAVGRKAVEILNNGENVFEIASDGFTKLTMKPTSTINAFEVYDAEAEKSSFLVKSNGNVFCRKMQVTLNDFPDYVFENSYKLKPLEEVSSYIAANKHLPGMPAAITVEKEGADLGELSRLSVEKIEELYLHVISLNERVKKLEEENAALKKGLSK